MRTLHASKELRTKFSEAARIITSNTNYTDDIQTPPNKVHLVSEAGLREVLSKRLRSDFETGTTVKYDGTPVEQSTHARFRIEAGKDIISMMKEELASMMNCPPNRVKSQGAFWHPPGCYTQWHTDPNFAGWRVLYTYADRPNESFIRWMENGEVKTSYDTGFDLRMFYAGNKEEFWNCTYSGKADRVDVCFHLIS